MASKGDQGSGMTNFTYGIANEAHAVPHTPAPWCVMEADPTTIYGPRREYLASFDPTHIGVPGSGYQERIANARLSAAAPDLLESLEGILGSSAISWFGYEGDDLLSQARAAIAKARSEARP